MHSLINLSLCVLQVCLQGPAADRLLCRPSAVQRLSDVRWGCPGNAAVLRLPAPCHRPPPAKPRLILLCPAAMGSTPPPVSTSYRSAHPGSHDQVTDGRGCGRDMPPRLSGEVSTPHHQGRRPTYKNRHAQETLPSLGRPLRRQAPAEDYKHPAVHNTRRCGHTLPWWTPTLWTVAVWVLTLTHTHAHTSLHTKTCAP